MLGGVRTALLSSAAVAPDIFILAGQSNIVGYQTPINGALDTTDTHIQQYPAVGPTAETLVLAADPLIHQDYLQGSHRANTVGPGMQFARDYYAATGKSVLLVPTGYLGTSINTQWANPSGAQYKEAVRLAKAAVAKTGGVIKGILWSQGEADIGITSNARFTVDLEALIHGMRAEVPTAAGAPFIVLSMTPEYITAQGVNATAIDTIHRAIPNRVSLTAFVAGASGNTVEPIHYEPAQQRINGHNMYLALATAKANVVAYPTGWDASTSHTSCAFSGANSETLSYAALASGVALARSRRAKTSGRWYAEFTVLSGNPIIGIVGCAAGENNSLGVTTGNAVALNPGNGFAYPSATASGISGVANDVFGLDIDLDNHTVRFNKNNGAWSAAQAIDPTKFGSVAYLASSTSVASHQVKINQTLTYAPPSGALSWLA